MKGPDEFKYDSTNLMTCEGKFVQIPSLPLPPEIPPLDCASSNEIDDLTCDRFLQTCGPEGTGKLSTQDAIDLFQRPDSYVDNPVKVWTHSFQEGDGLASNDVYFGSTVNIWDDLDLPRCHNAAYVRIEHYICRSNQDTDTDILNTWRMVGNSGPGADFIGGYSTHWISSARFCGNSVSDFSDSNEAYHIVPADDDGNIFFRASLQALDGQTLTIDDPLNFHETRFWVGGSTRVYRRDQKDLARSMCEC